MMKDEMCGDVITELGWLPGNDVYRCALGEVNALAKMLVLTAIA